MQGYGVKTEYGMQSGYQGGDQVSMSGMGGMGGMGMRSGGYQGGGMRRQPEDFKEGKIFIGALSYDTTQQSLENYCCSWGQIQDTFVMEKKGYGFITFANIEDAFRFLEHQNHTIDGRTVEVKAAVPKSKGGAGKPTKKLFVGGVPREVTNEELKAHFSQYGDIEDAAIVADQQGVSRGFGFVTYSDPICIEKALIVKHVLHDRQVDCKRAVPKDDMRNAGDMRGGMLMQGGYGMGGGMGGRAGGMGGGMGATMNPYAMNPMAAMGGYGMYGGYGAMGAMGTMGGYGAYAQDTRAMGAMGGYGTMGGAAMGGYGAMGGGDAGGYGRAGRGAGRQDRYQPY